MNSYKYNKLPRNSSIDTSNQLDKKSDSHQQLDETDDATNNNADFFNDESRRKKSFFDEFMLKLSNITSNLTYYHHQLLHELKRYLHPILILLPAPVNPNRSENKLIFIIAIIILAMIVLHNIFSTPKFHPFQHIQNHKSNYEQAFTESLGFFDDISNQDWQQKKTRVRSQPKHNDEEFGLRSKFYNRDKPHVWFQHNWEMQFTCPHPLRLGGLGDGAKWTCDPHRIYPVAEARRENGGNSCLVYSFGLGRVIDRSVQFDFSFELALLLEMQKSLESRSKRTTLNCQVHVFDPKLKDYHGDVPHGLILHPWGLEGTSDANLGRRDYLTLKEIVHHLNHDFFEIDVMKVDCEACEWNSFREWFDAGITMRQILVELHGSPRNEDDIFELMEKENYVIFSREADTLYGGVWQEYGWLKLSPDFFQE